MLYKGIIHNVFNDAPFIGALIIADGCNMPCPDCLNEHMKTKEYTMENSAEEIISLVKKNGLNEGVILSGLEWSEQPEDLVAITEEAIKRGLEVIVYTHHEEVDFFGIVPELIDAPIYVKFGLYEKALRVSDNMSYGVLLATSNQYIKYVGSEERNIG